MVADLVIIGSGPTGLTAAIYAAREGMDVVVYEKAAVGGLLASTSYIENYPGFPEGISGGELASNMRTQAERFGAKIGYGEVTSVKVDNSGQDGGHSAVSLTADNKEVTAKTALIATGWGYKKLGVKGEDTYVHKGVHYCATCDGPFYKDKKVAVIGGANSAVQEALFLAKFTQPVHMVVRSYIKASSYLKQELKKAIDDGRIVLYEGVQIQEIIGDDKSVTGLKLKGEKEFNLPVDGIFIFAGVDPASGFLQGSGVKLDDSGYVKVNDEFATNLPGVFAAGDIRSGSIKQVVAACGEGAAAVISIREHLKLL